MKLVVVGVWSSLVIIKYKHMFVNTFLALE